MRDALNTAWQQLYGFGYVVTQAVIVFVIAAAFVRIVRRPLRRRLKSAFMPENGKTLLENAVSVGIYVAAATVLLALWGASWNTLLTAIGVSTLLVALGLQSTLQSFVAGIFILFERPYNVGDHIQFSSADHGGTVEEIAFRTTIIRSEDGTRIVTPNSLIFTQSVENHSPDRATRTVIKINNTGAVENEPTEITVCEQVEAALVGIPGLKVAPIVLVRSRFKHLRVPGFLSRFRRVHGWSQRLVHRIVQQTSQVQVIWSGSGDLAVREEVLRRLKELFPESSLSLRRW